MIWRWNGTASSAWTTSSNWVDETGAAYASGSPGDTAGRLDEAYFDQAATNGVAGATIANKLACLKVGPAYDKDLASSGTYLACTAGEVVIDAAMNVYLDGGAGTGFDKVLVLGSAASKKVYLKGNMTSPVILDGNVQIDAGTVSTALSVGVNASSSAAVIISSGVTLPSDVRLTGGAVTNSNALAALDMLAGTWAQNAGDITAARVYDGTLNWNAGNIGTLHAFGGVTTAANGVVARRIGVAHLHQPATLNLDNGLDNVHVTEYVEHLGGGLSTPTGYKFEEYKTREFAGASDAKFGIAPQEVTEASPVYGDDTYVGLYDRLEVFVTVGATDATEVKCELFACLDPSTHTGEAEITDPAEVAFDDSDDNQTKRIVLWGYKCPAGKPSVRAKVTVTGGTAALVAVLYVKHKD